MRCAILVVAVLAMTSTLVRATPSVPLPAPVPPDPALAGVLAKSGWTHAELLLDTPEVRVVTAAKRKSKSGRHVVLVGPDGKLRDAGKQRPGTVTVVQGDADVGFVRGYQEIQIHTSSARANAGYHETSQSLLLRADGSIACVYTGPSASSAGTACGSGGWTGAHAKLTALATGTALDVTYDSSGTWSEPDAQGACLQRSPVRSGPHTVRYLLDDKRACQRSATLGPQP